MKKSKSVPVISILLTVMALSLFSGCTSSKYTKDISYMSDAQKAHEEQLLNEYLQKYDSAKTNEEKLAALEEIGFRYMNLGKYDKAISYYEQVLPFDPIHYPALTNLAVMYEEGGETKKALEYEQKLFDNYTDNSEVVSDFIRLLLANKDYVKATDAITKYSETEKGKKYQVFVKEQQDLIQKAVNKK